MLVPILSLTYLLHMYLCQDLLKQKVYVGQSVKLKCGPIDRYINFKISFRWEKPIGNVIGTESTLSLKSVDFKDGGTYTCRATHTINDKVIENTLSTQLLINRRDVDSDSGGSSTELEPPTIKFSGPDKDSLELMETGFLYSACTAKDWANADYVAQWTKYQRPLNGGNANLFIFPLDADRDSGTYTCQIYHKNFPEQKYERELRVTIQKPEVVIETLPGEDLNIGGRIYRKCSISNGKNGGYEQLTYTWLRDNSESVSTSNILNIPIIDDRVNGEYSCAVKSSKGDKKYMSRVSVRVGGTSGSRQSNDYKISIFTQPMSPEVNNPFQLNCQVYPPLLDAQFQWIKDGIVISNQQVLSLPLFQKQDIGSYVCKVTDLRGVPSQLEKMPTAAVKVTFLYSTENKIELSERGSQMISRVGEKRELHCEIPVNANSGGQNVQWFFNSRKIDDATQALFNMHRLDGTFVSILSLMRIDTQNEGQYLCEVNGVRKSANLIVLEEIISMEVNPEKLVKDEGQPVEFHCRVNNIRGFINTQVSWSFTSRDGRRPVSLTNNRRWEIMNSPSTPETSFISTQSCLRDDDGFYTCTAPSGQQKVAELVVRPKKENILLTISPEILRVRANQPITVECFSVSSGTGQPSGNPKFSLASGRSLEQDERIKETDVGQSRRRINIPGGLGMFDNGKILECRVGDLTKTAIIYLENECPTNYRRCNNGNCLPSAKFCDGVSDCSDGSDEITAVCNMCDPVTINCEYNDGKSPIKKTFLGNWRCDGENDCGNNYDESKCTEEDAKCNGMNFTCLDGKVIPRAYQCDKESDCTQNDDETGCRPPQITKTTEERIQRVRRGNSVTLMCESTSTPKSHILWRHNWGCLKDRSRMYTINTLRGCSTVVSSLTISNFQPGDDGIYNCEALSSQSRAFSDDFQLILESI